MEKNQTKNEKKQHSRGGEWNFEKIGRDHSMEVKTIKRKLK